MKIICNLQDLKNAQQAIEHFRITYPHTFNRLLHLVNFTRQLQFKYEYLCGLMVGREKFAKRFAPHYDVPASIIELYKNEIEKINEYPNEAATLRQLFDQYRTIGYENFCLLVKGKTPEEIKDISTDNKIII
ncbi:hypothetical protein QS257_20380 [Terrilactibacillus sp. S3-3]|nr:hypothetical protein QS257_20380 [Terrilactibacillus sp. S3-3]